MFRNKELVKDIEDLDWRLKRVEKKLKIISKKEFEDARDERISKKREDSGLY